MNYKEEQAKENINQIKEIMNFNEKQASNNISQLFNPTKDQNEQVRKEVITELEEMGVFD